LQEFEKYWFSLGVLFFNDVATNELEVAYAFGDSSEFIRGLRILSDND
jgi:hypothetical protein